MTRRFLCWFLTLVLVAAACTGQTPQADKIRQQVGKIGVLGNITVSVANGTEYYGSVSRIGTNDFAINEVDQRREITFRGQRIHPHTRLIVTLAVVGGLLALVFIAVASDKS